MKSLKSIFLGICVLVLCTSSTTDSVWGTWERCKEYQGIEYRSRNLGMSYDQVSYNWEYQFRNNYPKDVFLSYEFVLKNSGQIAMSNVIRIPSSDIKETKTFRAKGAHVASIIDVKVISLKVAP